MAVETGTRLGHYEIRSRLGAGGMGEVYLAQDSKLDRKVALKILPAEVASNQDRMRRFVQEAKAAAALNHPNIAHIYEIAEHDGVHFIAMEFVDGVTLREKIHRERTELRKLLRYLQHVAEGLAKAHAAGIVHRDLKPDNIMITRDGYAKILDFGLAKLIDPQSSPGAAGVTGEAATAMMPAQPLSAAGTVMGTVGYMSPEQAQGKTVDQRSDIFSFGCILYEAATGRRPFEGDSAIDTLHKIIYAPAPPIADFNPAAPADLQRIVRRCLAKDPEKRRQTIRDVANDLEDLRREMESEVDAECSVPPRSRASAPVPDLTSSDPQVAPTTSSAEYIITEIKRHKTGAVIVMALLVLSGLGYAIYHFTARTTPAVAHFQNMRITRVTSEGNVESAAVSPDGKYTAYSLEESGKRSLWTKHLGTGSRVQIAPATEAFGMNASTFSHDGGYVYYTRVDEQNPQGALYQVPVLGGVSKKILANVAQPVSLSPDGKQLAFGRYHLSGTEDELWLANADGTNERRLITVKEPEWLGGASAAWSPDGKMLAVGYGNEYRPSPARQNLGMTVAVVSVTDATLKLITSQRWLYVGNVVWFSDGSGLALISREQVLGAPQIWQVSYPQGQARRITNDLNSYDFYSLTLTADASALISVQSDPVSNIWVAPGGQTSRARAITSGKNVQSGHYGLWWTPDGKLVYDSNVNGNASIWISNADGSDPKPLTDSAADDFAPEVSPDGHTIIFNSGRTSLYQVWRMDIDGGNPKQLTEGTGVPTFSISPDGRWIVYHPFEGGIRKVSIAGGTPVELVANGSLRYPQVSPDGKLLAYFFNDERTQRPKIAVIAFDGGAPVRTFDLPVSSGTSLYESGFTLLYRGFHWSPDGRALVYINTLGGVSNLWSQPLDGGAPKQITDFKSDLILNFAYSRDGRQLALARGNQSRDVVMISEVK
jgi:serine/threonine protein kinase